MNFELQFCHSFENIIFENCKKLSEKLKHKLLFSKNLFVLNISVIHSTFHKNIEIFDGICRKLTGIPIICIL